MNREHDIDDCPVVFGSAVRLGHAVESDMELAVLLEPLVPSGLSWISWKIEESSAS